MPGIKTYHRPESLDEALQLLKENRGNAAVLAGGTSLYPNRKNETEMVIDLQDIGLDDLNFDSGFLTCGAFVRLQDLAENLDTPSLIRDMVIYEGPNTFRNMSTIGGVIATVDWESELLAALLVYGAEVMISSASGSEEVPLQSFLLDPDKWLDGAVITSVKFQTWGKTASARVARTPADKPIVAAVARHAGDDSVLVALCGVDQVPVLLAAGGLEALAPPADFRGSSEYRKEMAKTLVARIQESLKGI